MSLWCICFVYKSLVLPQHHPPPSLEADQTGTQATSFMTLPCQVSTCQPVHLILWEEDDKAGFVSRMLDGQRKEVTIGGSEPLEGLESRVQGALPHPSAQPEMMRIKMVMDNGNEMMTLTSHCLSTKRSSGITLTYHIRLGKGVFLAALLVSQRLPWALSCQEVGRYML